MQKVIVLTDLHILPKGDRIIGLDPAARFGHVMADALRQHPDATHVILTGDLTHNGTSVEYAHLRALLADCPVPVSLMLGNHDRRAPFIAAFPDSPLTDAGFVQRLIDLDHARLILLDTLDEDAPDLHSGYLCPDRLNWLDHALDTAQDQPCILFTHHPAFVTGFGGMDRIGLRNRAELIKRLHRNGAVVQIVSGHIHRNVQGAAGGIPNAVFKSTCHQMPLILGEQSPQLSIDEPGAYGLLLIGPEGVVVHTQDVGLPTVTPDIYV